MNDIYPYNPHNLKYDYFYRLFKNYERFKKPYLRRCNESFERNGKRLGIFKYIPQNKRYGIVNEYGLWCWRNSINTHPYCLLDLYYLYKEFKKETLDFENDDTLIDNINKLFDFVDENFELLFTPNIEGKYFYNFKFRCAKSWALGQITTIAVMYKIREIFPDCTINNMDFSLHRGDKNDFKGIDVTISNQCGDTITLQIKSGKVVSENEYGYVVESSVNDLKSSADYYTFVDLTTSNTKIVTFKNDTSKIINGGNKNHTFSREILHPNQINESMESPQSLQLIAEFCFSNQLIFELHYLKDDVNKMDITDKTVTVVIADFKDPELNKMLSDTLQKLQETFK